MAVTSGGGARPPGKTRGGVDPGLLGALLLLVVGSYVALSIDVVRTGFGIKGDEATYVAMALSAAYDGDLVYEAKDIERFYQTYNAGPEGIFLKRGSEASYHFDDAFPFIRRETRPDDRPNRLYFGKAYVYSVAAAPFVRLAGLNGLLLFHVVLLSGVVFVGYRFLAARSPGGLAAAYVLGFFGASIVPLYAVWLTSEVFNVACVFFAYFLWFYKEVAPPAHGRFGRWLRGPWSNVAAAVLLGLATYSKPPNVFLIIPPVAFAWSRRRIGSGFVVGAVFGLVVAAAFGINAGITGEFNYQGGDRRTFYGRFPFEQPGDRFEELGAGRATNEIVVEESLRPMAFLTLLGTNLRYFLVGRHFGFLPFLFPGVVTVLLFLWPPSSRQMWQWVTLGTVAFCAVGLVIYMPYTWSGGGGPSGNRYFVSIYSALFFVTPPLGSIAPVLLAWIGGTLLHGPHPGQPVHLGQASVSQRRARRAPSPAGRADDGQRPADHARRATCTSAIRERPHPAALFSGPQRVSPRITRYMDRRWPARRHDRANRPAPLRADGDAHRTRCQHRDRATGRRLANGGAQGACAAGGDVSAGGGVCAEELGLPALRADGRGLRASTDQTGVARRSVSRCRRGASRHRGLSGRACRERPVTTWLA